MRVVGEEEKAAQRENFRDLSLFNSLLVILCPENCILFPLPKH